MKAAYLDTSFLLAILFDEPGAAALRPTLGRFEPVVSSDLLTAETLSASVRYVRRADAWHVACALFVADAARSELAFLSRDGTQRRVARGLGFSVP